MTKIITSQTFARCCGPYYYLIKMLLIGLALLSVSRLLLILWLAERVLPTQLLGEIVLQGLRADLLLMCLLMAPAALLALVWGTRPLRRSWFHFSFGWSLVALIVVVFLELSTPSFIMQYDVRPNRIYVEYLKYPKEVFSTLWHGFKLSLILGIAAAIIATVCFTRLLKAHDHQVTTWRWSTHLIVWPLVMLMIGLGIRSSLQHRPANPATFAITSDAMVNSLVINSAYSVLFAIYNLKHEARSSEIYGTLDTTKMIELTRDWPWLKDYEYLHPEFPTLHRQTAAIAREKPLNIVIVLQESMGATFVESLGGVAVTPRLEALKDEGIWFTNLYATGTRSVRGIEAVLASFMPTPAQSTVKLSASQQDFTTLATVLKKSGYHTQFIYGGEAHFDNMRSFFTGNGITQIVDLPQMHQPKFVGSWGASDEDLFDTALVQLEQLHQTGQAFFSLIFTSSNHEPFEFPDGRIELHESPKNTVNNAVKYADWAMGEFFDKAKRADYWDNTVFLVIADHDNRVYGSNLIPIEKFKIPGLILGGPIQHGSALAPQQVSTLMSQIDMAPTLLSLAGISSCHMLDGRDWVRYPDAPGRALIQFEDIFALKTDTGLTILRQNHAPTHAQFDTHSQRLQLSESPVAPETAAKALAHVQLPSYLYRERRYKASIDCD